MSGLLARLRALWRGMVANLSLRLTKGAPDARQPGAESAPPCAGSAPRPVGETPFPDSRPPEQIAMDIPATPEHLRAAHPAPKAKWFKSAKRPRPAPKEKPKGAPREGEAPRPAPHPAAENPEQWGQYFFRDAILDQLDDYFVYLK